MSATTKFEQLAKQVFYQRVVMRVTPVEERLLREAMGKQRELDLPQEFDTGRCKMTVHSPYRDLTEAWLNNEPSMTGDPEKDEAALKVINLRGYTLNEVIELASLVKQLWFQDPYTIPKCYNIVSAYLEEIRYHKARSPNFRRISDIDMEKMQKFVTAIKTKAEGIIKQTGTVNDADDGIIAMAVPVISLDIDNGIKVQEASRIAGVLNGTSRPTGIGDRLELERQVPRTNPYIKSPLEI